MNYVNVRNVPVRQDLIDLYKTKYGGKLVTNKIELRKLDFALARYRKINGKDPENIRDDHGNFYLFEEVTIPINALVGLLFTDNPEVKIPGPKPIWFRVNKLH